MRAFHTKPMQLTASEAAVKSLALQLQQIHYTASAISSPKATYSEQSDLRIFALSLDIAATASS